MAVRTPSAQKRARQSVRRRLRNRKQKRQIKEMVKSIEAEPKKEAALKSLPKAQSVIDRAARGNIIHRNAARRLKSRLAREITEKE